MIPVEILKVGLPMKEKPDVLQGTLALMVLKTLDFLCPQHGYRIARRIERICGDLLAVNQARALFQCQSKGSRMKFLRRFLIRLLNSATRRSADQRLRDEIAEHLALQIEENLSAAWPLPRHGVKPHSSLARPRRSGSAIMTSKASPSSRICSSTCGTRFACF